jgi:ankyrin repeat protein
MNNTVHVPSSCHERIGDSRVTSVAISLVEHGANITSVNPHTLMNPIHYASMTGRLTFLQYLFDQPKHHDALSVALRARDFLHYDPMLWALQAGQLVIMQLLWRHGSDLLSLDRDGHDGLWATCRNAYRHHNNHTAILVMIMLIAHGADYRLVIKVYSSPPNYLSCLLCYDIV